MGIAEMKVSSQRDDLIITHALGSCLGITVHDPVAAVGGLLHVMLPLSSVDLKKAVANPLMFVDTGVPKLFHACYQAGAQKSRLVVKAAGGASSLSSNEEDFFQIGKRNFIVLRKLLWKNGLLLKAYDVGGSDSRTMLLEIATGQVVVKANGVSKTL